MKHAKPQATKVAGFQNGDMAEDCHRDIPVTWGELTFSASAISEFSGA
jgi:hypothetical protein